MIEHQTLILTNQIKCKLCSDTIRSKHRHDFKWCSCRNCAVDGGRNYLRRIGNPLLYTEQSISAEFPSEDPEEFLKIREHWIWTSRDPETGAQEEILLKDLDTEHILAILKTQGHVWGTVIEKVLWEEIHFRALRGEDIEVFIKGENEWKKP